MERILVWLGVPVTVSRGFLVVVGLGLVAFGACL